MRTRRRDVGLSVAPQPSLSVVVLTHDAFRHKSGCIRHTLTALARQKGIDFEVLVVDNGSHPTEHEKLKAFCADPHLGLGSLTVEKVRLSIAEARNFGARATRADVIVFLDDDAMLLEADALRTVALLASGRSHGYGARRLWTPKHPWFAQHHDRVLAAFREGQLKWLLPHLGGAPAPTGTPPVFLERTYPGHFGFIRRSLFDAVGGFPSAFSGYGCEDDAFALVCLLAAPDFGWLGDLRVAHVDHPTPSRYTEERARNLDIYRQFLAARSLGGFRIDLLLGGHPKAIDAGVFMPLDEGSPCRGGPA